MVFHLLFLFRNIDQNSEGFVTCLTTELLETSSLRIIDVQLFGERREHSIVLFCFRFLSPIMRYYPSGMVNPL